MTSIDEPGAAMLTLPSQPWSGPVPSPDIDSAPFWEALREHRLQLSRCAACRHWIHPPMAACPACHSMDIGVDDVVGTGTVYSFTLVNRVFAPGILPPYVAALVDLDEQPHLRVVTNLVNVRIDEVRIGMRVEAVFADITDDATLVYFQPARELA